MVAESVPAGIGHPGRGSALVNRAESWRATTRVEDSAA